MDLMEKIVSLCKRRGFIFPGSEIYGGFNGTWDLGPLGVLLSKNVKNLWWDEMVFSRDNIVGIDSSVLHHPEVWRASGHVESFVEPLMECKKCHRRFRQDLLKDQTKCSECGGSFMEPRMFNGMFKTYVGPVEDNSSLTYLRPETAQGIFINFKNVLDSTRVTVPFGIAQIGKGFRNEITTGNFLFRVREFEMMELEFFVKPGTENKWFKYWQEERLNWYLKLGIKKQSIKLIDLPKKDIAHYSRGTTEIWYNWPFMGFGELEGIASRGDYDFTQHQKHSGRDLTYLDPETGEKYLPYVIEPSVGVGRAMLSFLIDSYDEDGDRLILKLHPKLAPVKVAVFPLLANKEELVKKAREVYLKLKLRLNSVAWDDRGNIGKRYFAQDEIGTPWCVTVDFTTLEDNTVTVRDRDTAKQVRMPIDKLLSYFDQKLA